MHFNPAPMLRVFDVSIATAQRKATHRVIAENTMAAYRWALQEHSRESHSTHDSLRSLVIKPSQIF